MKHETKLMRQETASREKKAAQDPRPEMWECAEVKGLRALIEFLDYNREHRADTGDSAEYARYLHGGKYGAATASAAVRRQATITHGNELQEKHATRIESSEIRMLKA